MSQAEQEACIHEKAKTEADAMILKQIKSMLAENPVQYQTDLDRQVIRDCIFFERDAKIARLRADFVALEEFCYKWMKKKKDAADGQTGRYSHLFLVVSPNSLKPYHQGRACTVNEQP